MAPKRKAESEVAAKPVPDAIASRRVTRSMRQNDIEANIAPPKNRKEKSGKKAPLKTVKETKNAVASRETTDKEDNSVPAGEKTPAGSEGAVDIKKSKSRKVDAAAASRTIVIERCTQCNAFKTRALQVKEALEKGVPNITVLVNPDKPRRGCFEIREQDGERFITLLDMKRPFKPMKDLDMKEVIADIITKITAAA